MNTVLQATTLILVFGVAGQFLGRLVNIPGLIVLLLFGALLGPVLGWLEPSEAYGQELVLTIASLGVGLLLFEGGLQLRWRDLGPDVRRPLTLLVSLGVALTVAAGTVTCALVLGLELSQALLLGAILSVSGPTVVGPLVRASQPREPAGTLLRWEGILIDPIGALVSVTVLSLFFTTDDTDVGGFLVAAFGGIAIGVVAAAILIGLVRLGLADDLEVAIVLATVVAAYACGEWLHSESGLFATTTLGLVLANQHVVPVRAAEAFSGVISVLVIGALFITLVAEVDFSAIGELAPQIALLCVVLAVTRMLVVQVCTVGTSTLTAPQRVFMGLMAPRGVVAAATAASFSLTLSSRQTPFPELVAVTYGVIIGMAVLACSTIPAAGWLGVRRPRPRGLLLISSEDWTPHLASAVGKTGVPVFLLAPGRGDISQVDHVRLEPASIEELESTPVLDEVEFCVIGLGSSEMRGYSWTLASERMGRKRARVIPVAGQTQPGIETVWKDIPADSLRHSTFVARRITDAPDLGEIQLLRVRSDGSIDFDPYSSRGKTGEWVVVAKAQVAAAGAPAVADQDL